MKKPPENLIRAAILLLLACSVAIITGRRFFSMHVLDPIYPSPQLTDQKLLSDYFSSLRNTPGDTPLFIFKGKNGGGRLLILGGTHPNEPAGSLTAVLLVENLNVQSGTVIVVPWANRSAFTHNDPQEGNPQRYTIDTEAGGRHFRFGSRLTNPVHQWPDPALYTNPSGQKLAGTECRNLNRCYPGRAKGYLTEKVAFGIMEMMRQEKIDLAFDLHESAPEYPVINAIVFHENSSEMAAMAAMELQLQDMEFRLEASPPNLRGLSHREWGDFAGVKSVLLESANASHGRLKGKPSTALILEGKDKNYVKAAQLGRLFVPFDEEGIPLRTRVARHLAAVKALLAASNELDPSKKIEVLDWPSPEGVKMEGIGPFLAPPNKAK